MKSELIISHTDTPGTVGGTVPATLALTLGAPATFGAFTPGVAKEYTASTTATVISSAGDATLRVADPSTTNTGKLVNGTFALASPLQGLGVVKTWTAPTSNESVPVTFKQSIAANEPLRTGTYSKTLTFTLSTTSRRQTPRAPAARPAPVEGPLSSVACVLPHVGTESLLREGLP